MRQPACDRAAHLALVEAGELAAPRSAGHGRREPSAACHPQGLVLESVLRDRVARARVVRASQTLISGQRSPSGCRSRAGIARERAHAVDSVVVQPVADQGAALPGRGLDVVDRDSDRRCALRTLGARCALGPCGGAALTPPPRTSAPQRSGACARSVGGSRRQPPSVRSQVRSRTARRPARQSAARRSGERGELEHRPRRARRRRARTAAR